MKNILYIIALILVVLWALGSFAYHVGSAFIHLLLVIAVIMIIMNLFRSRRPMD